MITKHLIAESILKYCRENNVSQTELAKEVGVRQQSLNDWVREKTGPTWKNLEKLQQIIGKLEDE